MERLHETLRPDLVNEAGAFTSVGDAPVTPASRFAPVPQGTRGAAVVAGTGSRGGGGGGAALGAAGREPLPTVGSVVHETGSWWPSRRPASAETELEAAGMWWRAREEWEAENDRYAFLNVEDPDIPGEPWNPDWV